MGVAQMGVAEMGVARMGVPGITVKLLGAVCVAALALLLAVVGEIAKARCRRRRMIAE